MNTVNKKRRREVVIPDIVENEIVHPVLPSLIDNDNCNILEEQNACTDIVYEDAAILVEMIQNSSSYGPR
jgi:hypothetical protein